jgi:hypothetical protein
MRLGMEKRIIRTPRTRRQLPVLNTWVIFGALIIACVLSTSTLILLWLSRLSGAPKSQSTAILQIIPAVTLTATGGPSAAATTPGSEQNPPTPPPGVISAGAYVQVIGTGGDGLRMRDQPGLNSAIRLVASEAEVFKVDEGPVEADGYTWFRLVGPFDETRQGWAVANFLSVVQNP